MSPWRVGAGVGRVDGLAHHVEGRERVERAGGAHAFVAEQLHDGRQWHALLVEVHGTGPSYQAAVDTSGHGGARPACL